MVAEVALIDVDLTVQRSIGMEIARQRSPLGL
jgi:hypothetical protein